MFKVTVTLVFACYFGIHSMSDGAPTICQGWTCHNLVSNINDHMKDIELKKGTHAKNVTNCKLIECNLNIFTKELNKRWGCEDHKNHTKTCQFSKLLECIPYSCKVLKTTCEEPDEDSVKQNLKNAMEKFLATVSRELKSREDEGNSCESMQHVNTA